MDAALARIGKQARHTVSRNARIAQPPAVGVAAGHGRDHRHAGPHLVRDKLDRAHHLRIERRRRADHRLANGRDPDFRIVDDFVERLLDVADIFIRQHAAIHRRTRGLRQRVLGVSRFELCCYTGGADLRVIRRTVGELLYRSGFDKTGKQAGDGPGNFAFLRRRDTLEITARDVVQVRRKIETRQPRQSIGKTIDRIVAAARRAVPAGIGYFQPVGLVDFLGKLDRIAHRLAVAQRAAATFVDRELGINQRAVVL